MRWSEKELQKRLLEADVEYLCELVLGEDEFSTVASIIRGRLITGELDRHPLLLTVFAVSVAYHDYDERGFWARFFDRVDLEYHQKTVEYVGSIIENCLRSRDFISGNRKGTFRYVGPILEQSGITKRYLKRYVQILQEIARKLGWDGIRVIPFQSFRETVGSFPGSKFLIGFLKQKEGWEFTRGVARNYIQYRDGILAQPELSALKGYHPDFWELLVAEITEPPKRRGEPIPPRPKFVFDPEYGQLALVFDSEFVKRGRYEMNGSLVRKSILPIDTAEMVCDEYFVSVSDYQQRRIQYVVRGWNPKAAPTAFFAFGRGYVPGDCVGPGEYYFLTPAGKGIPAGIPAIVTHEFGLVSLPGKGPPYEVLRVTVGETDKSLIREDPFRWITPGAGLPGSCDLYEVFVNCLPRIRIERKDLFVSETLALVVDAGEGPKKVDLAMALGCGGELDIPVSIPGKGMVWAEPLKRTKEFSREDEIGRRYFCVLPSLVLSWPTKLYEEGDEPEIRVQSDFDIRLEFSDGARRIDDRRWIVYPGASLVEGELATGPVRTRLAYRVNRARLGILSAGGGDIVPVEQFDEAFSLEATGIPGERALIAVEAGGSRLLGDVGRFGASGKLVFSSDMIRDAVKSFDRPIGRFAVVRNGQGGVPTSLWLMNFGRFIDCVLEEGEKKWMIPERFRSGTIPSIEQLLQAIEEGSFNPVSFIEALPKNRLGTLMLEAYATAAIFGGAASLDVAREAVHTSSSRLPDVSRKGLYWALQARSSCENEGNGAFLLESLSEVSWRPLPKRWRDGFDAAVEALKRDAELVPLFQEWLPEVKGPRRPGYKSRLGTMPSGDTLTDGWRSYLQGNFRVAFKKADFASDQARSPVQEMAMLLAHAALFRAGRFGQGEDVDLTVHKRLAYHLETVRFVDTLLSRGIEISLRQQASSALPVEYLPLREEDKAIFERRFLQKVYRSRVAKSASSDDLDIALCAYFAGKEGEREVKSILNTVLKAKGKVELLLNAD